MKKFLIAAAAVVAVMFASCEGGAGIKMATIGDVPEAKLATDTDTVSYVIGYYDAKYGNAFSKEGMDVDSMYMAEFLKGVLASADPKLTPREKAYMAGLSYGLAKQEQMKQMEAQVFGGDSTRSLNIQEYMAGTVEAFTGRDLRIEGDERQVAQMVNMKLEAMYQHTMEEQYKKYEAELAEQNKEYKKENEDYLASIAKKAGVKSLGDGVYYEVVTEGTGAVPSINQPVKIHYEGKTIDGSIFDSSYERNEAHEMVPGQTVPGFSKALTSMPAGSKWIVYIPYDQAYGPQGNGMIKGFSTLIFTIELLEIIGTK